MDYTPPSYKGMIPKWEATPTPTQHHLHHHQEIEWMSSSNNSSSSTPTMTAKVEVIDEDDGQGDTSVVVIEREHMFDKVVTPSDVGKLNRLVIPKQHAEKYFPLDSSNNEKGLLLNFEDRTGKPWRFRYSYWNSSQSYVMTKGWSRFVKEKKLDAGDVVSFQRGVGEVGKDKLFIDWRRRPDASAMLSNPQSASQYHHHLQHHHHHMTSPPASAAWTSSPTFMLRSHPYSLHQPYPYPPTQGGGGGALRDHQGTTHHHLSSMSLMNVLPSSQSHPLRSGSGYGFGFGNVVNPYPVTGSLIFLSSSSSSLTSSTSAAATTTSSTLVSQNVKDHQHHQLMQQQQQGGRLVMQVQREDGGVEPMVYESVPVVQGKSAAKRLRLFGVNMECPISHQTHDFDILSSSLASSSTPNHPSSSHHHHNTHYHQQLEQHQQHTTNAISMGPPSSSSSSSFPSSPSHHHQQHPFPSQLRPIYSGAPPEKGKSYTSSSSMTFDLDI